MIPLLVRLHELAFWRKVKTQSFSCNLRGLQDCHNEPIDSRFFLSMGKLSKAQVVWSKRPGDICKVGWLSQKDSLSKFQWITVTEFAVQSAALALQHYFNMQPQSMLRSACRMCCGNVKCLEMVGSMHVALLPDTVSEQISYCDTIR